MITAVVVLLTAVVVTVNVADVEPDGTVTLLGTLADELLLLKLTTLPPDGAAALNVTVPVEPFPPTTLVGFNDTEETVGPLLGGVMVNVACCELLPNVAVITAVVVVVTEVVVTVNEALVLPAATVTLLGTLADELLLESETTDPPEGAALESVTVPCEELPPVTLVGFKVTEETVGPEGGRMVSEACAELELYVAVTSSHCPRNGVAATRFFGTPRRISYRVSIS